MERFDLVSSETPQGYYMSRWSGEEIDKAITAASMLGQADSPQQALANLGAGVRPNDIDNAYFVGGGSQQGGGQLPINQQGQTSWSVAGPIISRWQLYQSGSVSLTSAGLAVTAIASSEAEVVQKIEDQSVKGKTKTLSAYTSAGFGTGTITFPTTPGSSVIAYDDHENFAILARVFEDGTPAFDMWTYPGKTLTWFYAKQEDDLGQTLAYQDSTGAWQLISQPDMKYSAQLAECQRYLLALGSSSVEKPCYGLCLNATTIAAFIPTPVTMRTTPVVTTTDFSGITLQVPGASDATITGVDGSGTLLSSNGVLLVFNSSGLTQGAVGLIRIAAGSQLILSAQL